MADDEHTRVSRKEAIALREKQNRKARERYAANPEKYRQRNREKRAKKRLKNPLPLKPDRCRIDDCVSYPDGGRGMCQRHYNSWYNHGDPRVSVRKLRNGMCSAPNCDMKARTKNAELCEKHYMRMYRNGTLEKKIPMPLIETHGVGYLLAWAPNHPLAKGGRVLEHRKVYYDAYGSGPFECFWCDKNITWGSMHIDHLDGSQANNDLDNLVASCPACNMGRGDKTRLLEAVSRRITFNGETLSVSAWARKVGVAPQSITYRLKNGWTIEEAVTSPRGRTGPRKKWSRPRIRAASIKGMA